MLSVMIAVAQVPATMIASREVLVFARFGARAIVLGSAFRRFVAIR